MIIRLNDRRHCRPGLPPQLLADLGQGLTLAIAEAYTTRDLLAQDAMLCHQILIAPQQFLIDGSRNIGQQVFLGHRLPLSFGHP